MKTLKRVTTITLSAEARERIEHKTSMFGGSVASFAAHWATALAALTDDDLREIQTLVIAKTERLKHKATG